MAHCQLNIKHNSHPTRVGHHLEGRRKPWLLFWQLMSSLALGSCNKMLCPLKTGTCEVSASIGLGVWVFSPSPHKVFIQVLLAFHSHWKNRSWKLILALQKIGNLRTSLDQEESERLIPCHTLDACGAACRRVTKRVIAGESLHRNFFYVLPAHARILLIHPRSRSSQHSKIGSVLIKLLLTASLNRILIGFPLSLLWFRSPSPRS